MQEAGCNQQNQTDRDQQLGFFVGYRRRRRQQIGQRRDDADRDATGGKGVAKGCPQLDEPMPTVSASRTAPDAYDIDSDVYLTIILYVQLIEGRF